MEIKKIVQIPVFAALRNLPVMVNVFSEFATAFEDQGCVIKRVSTLEELEDGGIILLDDAAGKYVDNKDLYHQMATQCPSSIFICWYWEKQPLFQPFERMICTGEYNMANYVCSRDRHMYFNLPNFVPLRLRASDPPDKIGMYPRHEVRDYCFMGGGYKRDWLPPASVFTGIYHQVLTNNYLPYHQRRDIYLSSIFALGFQSDENIQNGHLSQRIFEGLAYGCIVLCENPLASEFTNGAVVFVSSKEDMFNKMMYFKQNPQARIEKMQQGFQWVRQYGTNRYSAQFFLDKMNDLFDARFLR